MTWTEFMILAGWKTFIVLLGAAGSGAAVAFGLFKTYGEKWLDGKFAERLEKLKHEQSKEIEGMRQKVQSTFSRISKIHDKEFEVLPKAWFLLHDAHGRPAHLMLALKQYPDFDQLPELTFEAFLKESRLTDIQKNELRAASDRLKYYSEAIFWIELNDAHSAQVKLNNYIIENRIFMTPELQDGFSAVSFTLAEALIEHRQWKERLGHEFLTSSVTKVNGLKERISEVEKAVQARLRYDAA